MRHAVVSPTRRSTSAVSLLAYCIQVGLLAITCGVPFAAAAPVNLYVSPTGSDALNDGSFSQPFLTLARAKQEVQTQKLRSENTNSPINVVLRAGRYALTDTLEFAPEDSGVSAQAPVTYQAYCDAATEAAAISVLPFPYSANLATPPRLLWNGVGDKAAWTGPVDPFLQMGVNVTSNSLLAKAIAPPVVKNMDINDVCVDKNGLGHTCYAAPLLAPCITGCMTSCALHLERKVYAEKFYKQFTHLFGKDLRKEEDCVEICSLSCRGCEKVTLSGSKLIAAGSITSWVLLQTLTSGLKVFRADLSSFLPAPFSPDTKFSFSTLYVDDVQYPRAGFPNCLVRAQGQVTPNATLPSSSLDHGEFNCSFFPAKSFKGKPVKTMTFDSALFSTKASQWTNVQDVVVELRPNSSEEANLFYSMRTLDAVKGEIALGAGGAERTSDIFENGPEFSSKMVFRVDNAFEELDSPGEWFFDSTTKLLYLIPLDSANATTSSLKNSVLEIPFLRQLVRVSGSRENTVVQAAHASTSLLETDSKTKTSHLRFRHLTFSGTQLLHTDVYERIPGSPWPVARVAALFMETVEDIFVEHCTFEKIRGNAIVVSGESDTVQLVSNNVSFVGSSGIAVLARRGYQRNSFRDPVLTHLLYSRNANISFNQIHHFGRRVAHSAAIMTVGACQTTIQGNLIYEFPRSNVSTAKSSVAPHSGVSYFVQNANGAMYEHGIPLIRSLVPLTIPQTLAQNLATLYQVQVPVTGFDIPIIAKLIGAPECVSGTGRVGALYGDPEPFTYTNCSGCCSVHDNFAKIRVLNSGVAWADATAREVILRPGDTLELSATSSAFFNSVVDVYLGFHVVTPNQILDLTMQAKWQILTRRCQYAESTYQATCSGPCAPTSCGNSNIAIQQNGRALQCDPGFEADVDSHVCTGPFEEIRDCSGTGVLESHVFYNCVLSCFTTSCT